MVAALGVVGQRARLPAEHRHRRRCAAPIRGWLDRRFGVDVPLDQIAACVGTKEFVATTAAVAAAAHARPRHRALPGGRLPDLRDGRDPRRLPAGARCRPRADGGIDLDAIDPADAARALMLWVNSPRNPTGALDDLGAAAAWGRAHGVPVFSDECYVEFTWDGPPRTILEHGLDGVVAVHSLSKRSNLAGLRVGFYAGDAELVDYLKEVRKHVGMLVPGPGAGRRRRRARRRRARRGAARPLPRAASSGSAAVLVAWSGLDDRRCRPAASTCGSTPATAGRSPSGWPARAARSSAPATSTAPAVRNNVRVAVVQPDDRIELVAQRLGVH